MQLTCAAWVESLNPCVDGMLQYIDPVKNRSASFQRSSFINVWFITTLKLNLCTTRTTQNTTDNKCIILRVQNSTALLSNVFSNGIDRLLVTSKRLSAFPSANHCQGRMQTPATICSSWVTSLGALVPFKATMSLM